MQICIDSINISNNFSAITILGDFNAHCDLAGGPPLNADVGVKFLNFLECNNLFQLIDEPTPVTLTGETILDLIITDSPGYFISTGTLSPPYNCDHNIIFANLDITFKKSRTFKRTVRNLKKVNVNALNTALVNANWDDVFSSSHEIDDAYRSWFDIFKQIIDFYIPNKAITVRPSDKPWMNGLIRWSIRRRDTLLKRFSNNKTLLRWERYRTQRNLVVKLIRKAKIEYQKKLNTLLSDPSTSAKKWWGIAKSLLWNKFCSPIPDFINNRNIISDSIHKAQIFNDYFVSQTILVNAIILLMFRFYPPLLLRCYLSLPMNMKF